MPSPRGATEGETTKLRGHDRPELLERGAVLGAAGDVLAGCARGVGQLLVVEGPAGIGKTSVLAEGRSRATEAGMEVLHARAGELERTYSYGVARQLFEPLIRRAADPAREPLFAGAAMHALWLFDPQHVIRPTATEDDAFALMHGLYWLGLNVAEVRPLVLAIDDLHWADSASLRWLSYLARRLEGSRLCVLVTVRSGEEEDPLLAELLADPATVILRLPPLTASAVGALVRTVIGADADDSFCQACHRASGGNPLLVRELVRAVEAEGIAPSAGSIGVVERLAPDAVCRSVHARLSRLPVEAGAVARAIAVLGDGADGKRVAQLADVDPRALTAAAAALTSLQLIHDDEPLRFVHPVVRNCVYQSMTGDERAEAHAHAAALIAAARAAPAAVSAQLLHAPPGAVHGAAVTLREAARRAASEGSPESATIYLSRALEESLPAGERADVLVELARARLRIGDPSALERLEDALPLIEDPQRRSGVQLQLARYQVAWNREDEATRTLERALDERGAGDDDQSRRLEAELLSLAIFDPKLRDAARVRLDSLAVDTSGGPGARFLLGVRAYHDAIRGTNRERALADARGALVDLTSDRYTADWSNAYGDIIHVLVLADDLAEAARVIDALLADARRRGGALAFSSALLWRVLLGHASAALVEAEADARLAFDAHPAEENIETPWVHALLAQVLVERGAVVEATQLLANFEAKAKVESLREEDRGDAVVRQAVLFRARARVAAMRGDHRTALADALAAGRIASRLGFVNPAVSHALMWRSEAALAHHFLGEQDDACELALEQLDLARRWGAPRTLGQALRILGLVEGGSEGIERLQEAAAVLAPSPARLEYGYALTNLGAALRRSNQRAAAREPLRAALDLAQRGGATVLAERAHEELIATGARPRRLPRIGVDALTPSERRVAVMAAEGLSNREIAQSLFVTVRTVETHLSSVFRKLDLSSRTQLATALARAQEASPAGRAG
jgi:DNA-binding CsgD family transcriptional regulator